MWTRARRVRAAWLVLVGAPTLLGCQESAGPSSPNPVPFAGAGGSAAGASGAPPWTSAGTIATSAGVGGAAGMLAAGGVGAADASGSGGVAGPAVGGSGFAGAAGMAGAAGASGEGGAPAGGSGVDAGVAEYRACPDSEPCKVLPLGDSITAGLGAPGGGGYRVPLFQKALDAGAEVIYVGSQSGGPTSVDGVDFPRSHEGHSGRTISFIAGRIPDPALDDGAHIVLLMIGTNDMYMQPDGAPERLAELLDEILELVPEALLVVAQLTPFPGADSEVQAYNAAIPPLVEARADEGKHILLVDMYTDFANDLIADGVHPNAAGYEEMAERWFAAIADQL